MINLTKRYIIPRFRRFFAILFSFYVTALFISTHVTLPDDSLPGGTDKIAHFVAYAGLSFLLLVWVSAKRVRSLREILLALFACMLFGAMDELLQIPVGRNCDIYDWIADVIGASIGILLFLNIRFFTPRDVWVQPLKNGDQHKL